MNNKRYITIKRVLIALVLLALLLSLAACGSKVIDKDDISTNISESESGSYTYVADYLRKWGIKNLDLEKMVYFEKVYKEVYGYEGGLPDTYEHAKMTAESFIELYYDTIDLEDKAAVTDAVLTCYADAVDDPYSVYRAPEKTNEYNTDMSGKFGGIGVQVLIDREKGTITVDMVFIDSPADKEGIAVGDIIYAVDGKTVDELGIDNVVNHMRGEIGTPVNIMVKRGENLISFNVTRDTIVEISASYEILEGNIGYVRISTFKDNTYAQFVACIDALEAAGVKGIIFDVRLNTGGYLHTVCDMISYLIPSGETIVSYQYVNQPKVVRKSSDDVHPTKKNESGGALVEDHVVDLPMVVLCNEYTASSAEIFTSAIRDYRDAGLLDAKIIGTVTYKKGIMQGTYMYREDYSSVTLTVAYYAPPCGINYHGIGITPDIEINNTETEDLQYNKALEEVKILINANQD
ncbi:MAG: PDZ domain-containing protein [Clostridia bacterium]|nr:PDZ domain-containing protein [Clostridia bacterium]